MGELLGIAAHRGIHDLESYPQPWIAFANARDSGENKNIWSGEVAHSSHRHKHHGIELCFCALPCDSVGHQ